MARVDPNPIMLVTVLFSDGRELVVTGPCDGSVDVRNDTEIVPCTDHPDCGAVHRRLTGAQSTRITADGRASWGHR